MSRTRIPYRDYAADAHAVAVAVRPARSPTYATADVPRPYHCAHCGAIVWLGPEEPLPAGWTVATGSSRPAYRCPECAA